MSGCAVDYPGAQARPSPNFGPRMGAGGIDMLILHYTGMESGDAAEAWLCDPASEVSSHYIVHEDGRIVQMVREADRAWHAGRAMWKGEADINSRSVGIEIVNPGHSLGYPDFPAHQIDAVIALCRDISARNRIAPERVLAHSDVAPGRKIDPGEKFPWYLAAKAGIGHWVEPSPPSDIVVCRAGDCGATVAELRYLLALYGYGIEINDEFCSVLEQVVSAFQRHFRPARVDGMADASTLDTLRRLIAALPETTRVS